MLALLLIIGTCIALIIIFRIHRDIFWITTGIEMVLHVFGLAYVYTQFNRLDNQFLYIFAITGIGIIIALFAFFLAAFLNQKHLHSHHE